MCTSSRPAPIKTNNAIIINTNDYYHEYQHQMYPGVCKHECVCIYVHIYIYMYIYIYTEHIIIIRLGVIKYYTLHWSSDQCLKYFYHSMILIVSKVFPCWNAFIIPTMLSEQHNPLYSSTISGFDKCSSIYRYLGHHF